MEPKSLLQCSPQVATDLYCQTDKSSPRPSILFP
jgi:hypothetical protein